MPRVVLELLPFVGAEVTFRTNASDSSVAGRQLPTQRFHITVFYKPAPRGGWYQGTCIESSQLRR
jgi:hypothetical protein